MYQRLVFGARDKNQKLGGGYDFYPTPEWAVEEILKHVQLVEPILEPCAGTLNISRVAKKQYDNITTFDIDSKFEVDEHLDFLEYKGGNFNTIITNPPFQDNNDCKFIKKALDVVNEGGQVIMLMKINHLESQRRKKFFDDYPIKEIYVHSRRLSFYGKTGICYAWFVWEKGYLGETRLKII